MCSRRLRSVRAGRIRDQAASKPARSPARYCTIRFMSINKRLVLVLSAAALILVAVWLYQRRVTEAPANVFYGALNTALSSSGVTCTVHTGSGSSTSDQVIQLNLTSHPGAIATTTLKQASSTVVTEELATRSSDYVRYTSIQLPPPPKGTRAPDVSSVLNVWGKGSAPNSVYSQTVLGGCAVPLADLSPVDLNRMMTQIRSGKIFQTNVNNAPLSNYAGQRVRTFQVTVQPQAYVTFMQGMGRLLGLNDLANIKASSYAGAQLPHLKFVINADTHQLLEVDYAGTTRRVTFTAWDTPSAITVPATSIPVAELMQRLAALK